VIADLPDRIADLRDRIADLRDRIADLRDRIADLRDLGLLQVAAAVGTGYLALAVAFSVLTPAWENNDEVDHVRYVEYVAAHGTPPRIGIQNGIESHQPPLYYYLAAGWQRVLGIDPFTPDRPPVKLEAVFAKAGWVLSHDYTPKQHDQAVSVHLLRVASIVLGLATVLAAVATGWLLTQRLSFAAALGATVALWPKFLVVTSAVTSSALVITLCACAVPCFLLWHRSRTAGWAAATGLLLGAAAIAQFNSLPVAGLMLILLLVLARTEGDWRSPLVAFGCFAAIAGWWFIRNMVLYGDPLASGESQAYLSHVPGLGPLVRDPPSLSLSVLDSSFDTLAHSSWYHGGWNQLELPHALDWIVWAAAAISITAAFLSPLRGRLLLATCVLGSLVAWLLLIRVTTQAEGRYLLVAIVAWATLLVAGAARLAGYRPAALWLWPAIMLGLDVYVLATWLIPDAHL
jgi:hypothetical protein